VYFRLIVASLVVGASAMNCPERFITEMTFYVSRGTSNSHSLACREIFFSKAKGWYIFLNITQWCINVARMLCQYWLLWIGLWMCQCCWDWDSFCTVYISCHNVLCCTYGHVFVNLFICLSVSNLYSGWLDAIHRASLLLLCDRIHCLIWDMFTAAHLCFHHSHLALTLFETIGRIYPFPSAVQRPSYGDCLEVKREYYHNCSVLDCVTQCSQSTAHLYEEFLQVQQIGFVTLGPLRVKWANSVYYQFASSIAELFHLVASEVSLVKTKHLHGLYRPSSWSTH